MGSLQAQLDDADPPMVSGATDSKSERLRVGRQIRSARQRARLTQGQLAERLGVNLKTVTNWECGNSSCARHMAAIRDALADTWQDEPEPVELLSMVDVQLDVRGLRDDMLLRLHDQVEGELRRRFVARQGNVGGQHGEPRALPPEARRPPTTARGPGTP